MGGSRVVLNSFPCLWALLVFPLRRVSARYCLPQICCDLALLQMGTFSKCLLEHFAPFSNHNNNNLKIL